jgi:AraC-like DNA-binding protein
MNENQVHMKPSTESKIKKVREYIDTHFANNMLSIPLLAEEAEISEVYLRKLFKQQYHISPSQYLISARIKKAKQLLEYRFLTLEECASLCGFSTVQYFCRVFKKNTGMTPSEYRNQQ